MFMFADAQPAVSWAVLDHERVAKTGYQALAAACAPVIVTAQRPNPSYSAGERFELDVHAVSDLREPLEHAVAKVCLAWPGGQRSWRFAGDIPADSCVRIGRVNGSLPEGTPAGLLRLDLSLRWDGGHAINTYGSRID